MTRVRLLVAVLLLAVLAGCAEEPEDRSDDLAAAPWGEVISYAAGPGFVVATVWGGLGDDPCDACAGVWRNDSGTPDGWRRVHDLGRPRQPWSDDGAGPYPPTGPHDLAMAPDGRNGLLGWDGGVLRTADGGRSWEPVDLRGADRAAVAVTSDASFVLTGDLWRAPHGEGRWQRAALPDGYQATDELGTSADALVLVDTVRDRRPQRSDDGGSTWHPVPAAPRGCTVVRPTGPVLVASCLRGDWAASWVSILRDGRWRTVYEAGAGSENAINQVVAVDEDTVLVHRDGALLRVAGPRTGRVTGAPEGWWDDAGFVDARTGYALAAGTLQRTTDGGRTWTDLGGPLSR